MIRFLLSNGILLPLLAANHLLAFSGDALIFNEYEYSEISLDYTSDINEEQSTGGSLTVLDASELDVSDGTPFSLDPDHMATHGVAELQTTGPLGEMTWTFNPDDNYHGSDSFGVLIEYAEGGENNEAYTEFVTISYSISATNDPITVTWTGDNGCSSTTIAVQEDETYTLNSCVLIEDESLSFNLVGEDQFDGISNQPFSLISGPQHGQITESGTNTWSYTSSLNYSGPDTLLFTAIDASGFSITLELPFEIETADDGASMISVYPESVLEQEAGFSAEVNRSLTFADPDGLTINDLTLSHADNGHLPRIISETENADSSLTVVIAYAALDDFYGEDLIQFSIADRDGYMTDLNVPIQVEGTSDTTIIIANDFDETGDEDSTITGTLKLEDLDGYSTGFLSVSDNPFDGTITVNETASGEATWIFAPASHTHGDQNFTFTATDDFDETTDLSFSFSVNEVNDPLTASITDGSGNPIMESVTFTDTAEVWTSSELSVLENDTLIFDLTVVDEHDGFDASTGFTFSNLNHGSISTSNNGLTWTYAADDETSGEDVLEVQVEDDNGNNITWKFPIQVIAVDDGGIVIEELPGEASEDVAISLDFTITEPDGFLIDNGAPSLLFANADSGSTTITFNGTYADGDTEVSGTIVYTSNVHFFGTDEITFQTMDRQGFSSSAKQDLSVANTPDSTEYTQSISSLPHHEDTDVEGQLTFSDPDGVGIPAVEVNSSLLPQFGSVILNQTQVGEATWTYIPAAHYFGKDTFAITMIDAFGVRTQDTIALDIQEVDDAMSLSLTRADTVKGNWTEIAENTILHAEQIVVNEDEDLILLFSPTDNDGITNSNLFQITEGPTYASASIQSDGTLTASPPAEFTGEDTLVVVIQDDNGHSISVNTPMLWTASDDGEASATATGNDTLNEETTGTINLTFSDPDGLNNQSIQYLNLGNHGTGGYVAGSINSEGNYTCSVTYTGVADYFGQDTLVFEVTDIQGFETEISIPLEISNVQDEMLIVNTLSSTQSTQEGEAISFDIQASDADGDVSASFEHDAPGLGNLEFSTSTSGNVSWTYTPSDYQFGTDSFDLILDDGQGETRTLSFTVNISKVNDPIAVTIRGISDPNQVAVVVDTLFFGYADTLAAHSSPTLLIQENLTAYLNISAVDEGDTIHLSGADADVSAVSFSSPSYGELVWTPLSGLLTYTPEDQYHGTDIISATFTDRSGFTSYLSIPIIVQGPNDDGGAILSENSFTATEETLETITFNVEDPDGLTSTALVQLTSSQGTVSYSSAIPMLQDDYAPENWIVEENNGGSVSFDGEDEVAISIPGTAAQASETKVKIELTNTGWFAFELSHPTAGSGLHSAYFRINSDTVPINSVTNVEIIYAHSGDVLEFGIDSEASNAQAAELTVNEFTPPTNNGSFAIDFLPNDDFYGAAEIGFSVSDLFQFQSVQLITVEVANVQDPTIIVTNEYPTQPLEDTPFYGTFLATDADQLHPTTPIQYTSPANGTITPSFSNAEGLFAWQYSPNPHFHGHEEFTITVVDAFDVTLTETISFDVQSQNDEVLLDLTSSNHQNSLNIIDEIIATDGGQFTTETLNVDEDDEIVLTLSISDNDGIPSDFFTVSSGPDVVSQLTAATANANEFQTTISPVAEFTGDQSIGYTLIDNDNHTVSVTVPFNYAKVNDGHTVMSHNSGTAFENMLFTDTILISDVDGLPITTSDAECSGSNAIEVSGVLTSSGVVTGAMAPGELITSQTQIDDNTIELVLNYMPTQSGNSDTFTLSFIDKQCFPGSLNYTISITSMPDETVFTKPQYVSIKEEENKNESFSYSDNDGTIISVNLLSDCNPNQTTPTGFTYLNETDTSIYYLSSTAVNYMQARIEANNAGGHLVTYENDEELNLINGHGVEAWIGISRGLSSPWLWTTGLPISSSNNSFTGTNANAFHQFGFLSVDGSPSFTTSNAQTDSKRFIIEVVKQYCAPKHGRFEYNASTDQYGVGSLVWDYVADVNFVGADYATFSFTDGSGATSYRTLLLDVTEVDDLPMVAVSTSNSSFQNRLTDIQIFGLDLDSPTESTIESPTDNTLYQSVTDLNQATGEEGYFSTEGLVTRHSFTLGSLQSSLATSTSLVAIDDPSIANSNVPSLTSDRYARLDSAIRLQGTGLSGASDWIPATATAFSVAIWFSQQNGSLNRQTLVSNESGSSNNFQLWVQNNTLYAKLGGTSLSIPFSGDYPPNLGDWHKAIFSYAPAAINNDPNTARLSLDGQMVTGQINTDYGISSGTVYLGQDPNGASVWTGLLDEFSIWNRPLSKKEFANMHMHVGQKVTVELPRDGESTRIASVRDYLWSERFEMTTASSQESDGQVTTEVIDDMGSYASFCRNTAEGYVELNADPQDNTSPPITQLGYSSYTVNPTTVYHYGCQDPDACNYDATAIQLNPEFENADAQNAVYCMYPDQNDHSKRCWNADNTLDSEFKHPMSLPVALNSDGDGFAEFDLGTFTLKPERNGCKDATACNYDQESTDSYPMFTGLDMIGVSDSSRFFITPYAMTRAEAEILATANQSHIATLSDVREALMVGFKSNWTEAWVNEPDTLQINGMLFEKLGSNGQSSYFISKEAQNPYNLELHHTATWNRVRPHLLKVTSEVESNAIATLMSQKSIDRAWLGFSDKPDTSYGEGNWNHLSDTTSAQLDSWNNWVMDPDTLKSPPHLIEWSSDDLQDIYDFGQIIANSTTTFADLANTDASGVVTLTPGQWLPVDREGGHFTRSNSFNEYKSEILHPSHLVLEFPTDSIAASYLLGTSANGYPEPTRPSQLPAIIEMPLERTAECGFPSETTCEFCADTAGMNLERLQFEYLGETDESHYYYSLNQRTIKNLRDEYSMNWDRLSDHLVNINSTLENDSIVALMSHNGLERVWLGITDNENHFNSGTYALPAGSPTLTDGVWYSIGDTTLVSGAFENWDNNEPLSGATFQFTCDELDYSTYDYAQLWSIVEDRRWHMGETCVTSTSQGISSPRGAGKWIPMPDHGVILSGEYRANLLLEFPKNDLQIMQGEDTDGNLVCSSVEELECLASVIQLSMDTLADGTEYFDLNEGAPQRIDTTQYLMGTGTYKIMGVPAGRAIRLASSSPFITITGSTASIDSTTHIYHYGTVDVTVTGNFGINGLMSFYNKDYKTDGKLKFHYASEEFNCAGICQSDENFNNICDELEGCMDPSACNYNDSAIFPSGTCVAAAECTGCTEPTACNYDINATISSNNCVFEDPANCQFCDDYIDGTGELVDKDEDADGLCDRKEGCTDVTACNFKLTAIDDVDNNGDFEGNPHYIEGDLTARCIYVDLATTPCGFCSPSQDGKGFVINGDIDLDGLCDVYDSDRRIPLNLHWYAGAYSLNISDSISITGPYSDGASIPLQLERSEYGSYSSTQWFTNLQFGQNFDITVSEPGVFSQVFLGMEEGEGALYEKVETSQAYEICNVLDTIQFESGALATTQNPWDKFSFKQSTTAESGNSSLSPTITGNFQSYYINETGEIQFNETPHEHSNLLSASEYSTVNMKVAASGTSANYDGSLLSHCSDTTGYSFFSAEFPGSKLRPSHCKTFSAFGGSANLGKIAVELSRVEDDTSRPTFKNSTFKATFTNADGESRDFYRLDLMQSWEDANTYDYPRFTGPIPSGASAAKLSSLRGHLSNISLLTDADPAWLDATLSVNAGLIENSTTSGLLWKWSGSHVELAFPAGSVSNALLGIDAMGPGLGGNFPLLNGSSTRNSVTYNSLKVYGSRIYVKSSSPVNYTKFNNETTFGFVADNSTEVSTFLANYLPSGTDRVWNHIKRNSSGSWRNKNDESAAPYFDWVAQTPLDGVVNNHYNFSNVKYSQLVRNLDAYPQIRTGNDLGRRAVDILGQFKMVPITSGGALWDLTLPGTFWGDDGHPYISIYRGTSSNDQSGLYEVPSWSSIEQYQSTPQFEDLQVLQTQYFYYWSHARTHHSWFNRLRKIGLSPGTFESFNDENHFMSYNWGYGDMSSGMRTKYATKGKNVQVMLDGSGREINSWTRWNGGQPDNSGQEINIEYWRKSGNHFTWNNEWSDRTNPGIVAEVHQMGGFQNATMVLETDAPSNQWKLTAKSSQFSAKNAAGSAQADAIFDKPQERLPLLMSATTIVDPAWGSNPSTGWTALYETNDFWYYVSSSALSWKHAERAASMVGGQLFSSEDVEANLLQNLAKIIPNDVWIGLEQKQNNGNWIEPNGGWTWFSGSTASPPWDTGSNQPNDGSTSADGEEQYGVLQINGLVRDDAQSSSILHKALIEIPKGAKAQIAGLLEATANSETGSAFLELDASTSATPSDSEPIGDILNNVPGIEMQSVQVTIEASGASTNVDLILEHNAETTDSTLIVLAKNITLSTGSNTIRFMDVIPAGASASSMSVDQLIGLQELGAGRTFADNFATKESLVKWRLHLIDREAEGTHHSLENFTMNFVKSADLFISAADTMKFSPSHGVYLNGLEIHLDSDAINPDDLTYQLRADDGSTYNINPTDIQATATALDSGNELLNGRWALTVTSGLQRLFCDPVRYEYAGSAGHQNRTNSCG